MSKSILTLLFLTAPLASASAQSCPEAQLHCSLERAEQTTGWTLVVEASAHYLASPLHCLARVALVDPYEPTRVYAAMASADSNTMLYTIINGEIDPKTSTIGDSKEAPRVLNYGSHRMTCLLD